jgi:hypothetical protein
MKSTGRLFGLISGVVVACLLSSPPLRGQQGSTGPQKTEPPKPAASSAPPLAPTGDPDDEQLQETPPPTPPNPYAGTIKDVGTGLPIFGTSSSPLRWGSFSIYTFEFIGLHDDYDSLGSTSTISRNLFGFRVGLMFDYILRHKSRIVLQYLPQLLIYDGEVHANAETNNNISVGTKFELTPRLSLTVGDTFVQVQDNSVVPQNFLAVDSQAGATAQNNFLNTNADFISNTSNATIEYALTPRTNLTLIPSFVYIRSFSGTSNVLADGRVYTGTVGIGHALTARRTVGITSSYQYLSETIGGVPQNVAYTTISGYYSEQLARTLWVSGNVGATYQDFTGLSQAGGWGISAGGSLTKAVTPRTSLALAYTRGTMFNNYVTRQRADRVDASIRIGLTSRIAWNNGFAYYEELGGVTRTGGKYVTTDLTYRFFGNFSLFTTFAYTYQNSATDQLLSGGERTLVYGIRWAPPRLAPK